MSIKLTPSLIAEIKSRNPIEDIISQYVSLKRAGSNYVGLCPFHSEKTPSFTVFAGENNFYCFGCSTGGDVITFVMKIENIPYIDAVKKLAARAGINLPEDDDGERGIPRQRYFEMNRTAARFFFDCFCSSVEAKQYAAKRGLDSATIKHFGIGYSPNDFSFVNFMKGKGFTDEELITGFLCKRGKSGGLYSIFRGRLMFPIMDISGNVIAFGGRNLGPELPKYLNSSDTPAFKKKYNLYALNYAKATCGEYMILCEGYMDVVALHAAGFTNAVATLGTAITEESARLMKRYTKRVIISYDNDAAGQKAADKAFRLLEEAGLKAKILKMEGAKDPDEYIKKFGKDAFGLLVEKSQSRIEFKIAQIKGMYDLDDIDGKLAAINDMADFIAGINSSIEREMYISRAAKEFEVTEKSLTEDVNRKRRAKEREKVKNEKKEIFESTAGYGDRMRPERINNLGKSYAEEVLIGLMLTRDEYINDIVSGKVKLTEEDFVTSLGKKAFSEIMKIASEGEGFDMSLLAVNLSADEYSALVTMKMRRQGLENGREVFSDCVNKLKEKKNKSLEEIINEKRKRQS